MKTLLKILIWLVTLFGLNGTIGLVQKELTVGNVCPKLVGIPACYIIFACLVLVAVSHSGLLKDKAKLYLIGAGTAWLIALSGSVGQLMGWMECPKTASGIPMCFLSLALFSSLLLLKWLAKRWG